MVFLSGAQDYLSGLPVIGDMFGGISLNENYTPTDTVQDIQDVLDLGSNFDITQQ